MKKKLIPALLVLSMAVFAQEPQLDRKVNKEKREKMSPELKSQVLLYKMVKELDLNIQQEEQIRPILAEQYAKQHQMREYEMVNNHKELSKDERTALMQKRKQEKTTLDNRMKTILTPEQFKQMKEMETVGREKMRAAREARQNRQEQAF